MSFTKRERSLLLILITLVVGLGGSLMLVMPLKAENEGLVIDTEILKLESVQMKAAINKKSKIEASLNQSKETISNQLDSISDSLTNENFDFDVAEIARKHNVVVDSLKYGDMEVSAPSVVFPEDKSPHYDLKTEIDILNNRSDEVSVSKVTEYEIVKQVITLQYTASYKDTKTFIDELHSGFKTMYIGQLNTDLKVNVSKDSKDAKDLPSSTLTLELYSVDKIKESGANALPNSGVKSK